MENSVYIIAEAGVNHDGSEERARQLIDIAADAGADAVKFQLFEPTALVTAGAAKADYQASNLKEGGNQLEMLQKLALPPEAFVRLAAYCKEKGIDFLCTPFDAQSLDFLVKHTKMPYLKLASGEVTNGPLLKAAAGSGLSVILSTGMSELAEVEEALTYLKGCEVTLLHCVSQYPAPAEATNLKAMDTLRESFGLPVGLSDHTIGTAVSIAAAARGAGVIEKHFTYDVNAHGPDHKASLSAAQLEEMVAAIRTVELALGDGKKICQPVEENTRAVARRSLVAGAAIRKGETFSEANLACKRPAGGPVAPNGLFALLGKRAKQDYAPDDFIQASELDPHVA